MLFGLQSYAVLGRQPYIRNGPNYFYLVLENVIFQRDQRRPKNGERIVSPGHKNCRALD